MTEHRNDRPHLRHVLTEPHWWIKDVLAAFIIGALLATGTVLGAKLVDDRRAEREVDAALSANRHDTQLENLRFVRGNSWNAPEGQRRFAEFDLAGQNLVGLPLAGADFARADLSAANLSQSDLSRANLAHADLHRANLTRSQLKGAYLGPERIPDAPDDRGANLTDADLSDANLTDADLAHVDLTGANLTRVTLTNVYYDTKTLWPSGFQPPPSRPTR